MYYTAEMNINLTMGDEDDCFSPYKCVKLFPSENEWPWSLSEEDVPGASLEICLHFLVQ
jgi:hypothetical protein